MTHAERARIKRQMSIGEHPGENDLNANEFSVKTYVHVNGEKYRVTGADGQFCTWVPGGALCDETMEKLRDKVIAALAERAKQEPVVANYVVMDIVLAALLGRPTFARPTP